MSEIIYLGQVFLSVALAIFIICITIAVCSKFEGTKSKQYRELLVDMYVVGTIRKLAEKDKIDLVKELQDFNKIEKKSKLSEKGLASVIEEELKTKIAEVQEETLAKA